VSPILTRPIREQLEHDRIIRQLQSRYKRKHEVVINPGLEQNQAVMVGELERYPDLLLFSQERGRRLEGTIEVETAESVNQLEALAEWGVFSRLKAPFYLFVPPQSIDTARRLCEENQFPVAEIWTYHLTLDQVRFTQVYRSPNAPKPAPAARGSTHRAASDDKARSGTRKAARSTPTAANGKSAPVRSARAATPPRPTPPVRPAKPAKPTQPARPARVSKSARPAGRTAATKHATARKRR
jgi:hypothetical protein